MPEPNDTLQTSNDEVEELISSQPEPEDDRSINARARAELPALLPAERGMVVYDPLQRYLQEIRRFEPLTAEEEHDLARRHHEEGDVKAAYRLVSSHLRLVVRIAFEFKRTWQNLLDLIQEGNVGLLLAVQKFDPYRGIRLSTYATFWIRAYIIKYLLDNWRLVKVGTTNARRKLLFNLRKEKDALLAEGIQPGPKLLAERLNVSEQDVIEVDRSLNMPDLSFETPLGADTDLLLGDTLSTNEVPIDQQIEEKQRHEILSGKLAEFAKTLPEREAIVFHDRLVAEDPATLQELGTRFGMTREGLRQVEKRLLKKLKAYLVAELKDLRTLGFDEPIQLPPAPSKPRRARSSNHA